MTAYELLRALGQADDPFVLQAAPVDDPAPAPQKRRQISARAKRLLRGTSTTSSDSSGVSRMFTVVSSALAMA